MLLPDTVGTGGDYTRFPRGISCSGIWIGRLRCGTRRNAIRHARVSSCQFEGTLQPGITLRDLVNAIPYAAIQRGLLTVAKEGKKNVFSGKILEIEGAAKPKVEQAFEISVPLPNGRLEDAQ